MIRMLLSLALVLLSLTGGPAAAGERAPLRIATFQVDATPPLGSPLCDGLVAPAKEIVDPLSARGIILLTEQKPIVLCVFDWVGIGNEGHDAFGRALADAVDTTPDRVSVHAIHQHDAPGCDFAAEKLLAGVGLGGAAFDPVFARQMVARVAAAARKSLAKAVVVTHIGLGTGIVEQVASNRRILGPDGKVALIRFSSCKNDKAIAAPEGTIDPKLRLVSFWHGDRPLASLTYYATHPQSYYGKGGVSADFPGLARKLREAALPEIAHLHFNGAGGNVAAGKYNDGSPARRPVLAQRLADGMKTAWDGQKKLPISAADVTWATTDVALPPRSLLKVDELLTRLRDTTLSDKERVRAARDLAFLQRVNSGRKITIGCLRLGPARILHMPGELFIEYQLAAQKFRPKDFVAMAAYGDYGPGYIGTAEAYPQGGYETGIVSRVNPEVEQVLMQAMRRLLQPD
jgi:hypothetical protein